MYFVCSKFRVDKGKAGRRLLKISGVAILQNAVAILQKKQENRPYTRLYGRFSYLRLSTYSSQVFRSELCLRSRFAHSYITVISCIHYGFHSRGVLQCPSVRFSGVGPHQRGYPCFCGRDVGQMMLQFATLSTKRAGLVELAQPVLSCRHAHTTATEHFQWQLSI